MILRWLEIFEKRLLKESLHQVLYKNYLLNPLRPLWGIGHQPLFATLAGPEPLL